MGKLHIREGKLSFFLLMLMLLSISWSMELAGWAQGLSSVEWTALGGLTVGFFLTRTRWPRGLSHLLSVAIGVPLILGVMTRFLDTGLGWGESLSILAYRFDAWLRVVSAGGLSSDNAMFVLWIAVVGWWLGYTSAWLVFGTHRVWQALALTAAVMLLVVYGSPSKVAPFFFLYIFCALLLAIRVYVYTQEQSWEKAKARYDGDVSFYFMRDGALLVTAILVVVWILPLLSSSTVLSDLWARIEGPWRSVGDSWNRLFSGVQGYGGTYENIPFGDRLPIGGPLELGDEVVMWIETDGGRYWRGNVYDSYDGSAWENTDRLGATIPADKYLPVPEEYELRHLVSQRIVVNSTGIVQIFGLGEPVRVDLPVEVLYAFASGSEGGEAGYFGAPATVSLIKSHAPVSAGQRYGVLSSVSGADIETLRHAAGLYPSWVAQRYLGLPATLPTRVRQLAEQITAPYDNAYDKASALQDYLRRTIAYSEDVELSPRDRDAVDYLLFDSRKGYCNHYASAMVVMARAVGIPSRLAVGYMGGAFDTETGQYEVLERDTHAWVEVYFPRYGWVDFEPTASEEPISRPVPAALTGRETESSESRSELERDLDRLRQDEGVVEGTMPFSQGGGASVGFVLLAAALLLASGIALAFWAVRSRWLQGLSGASRAYRLMCDYARLSGVKTEAYQTPHEFALLLAARIPSGSDQIHAIADLYVQRRFGPGMAGAEEDEQADRAWHDLVPLLRRELFSRLTGSVGMRLRRCPR